MLCPRRHQIGNLAEGARVGNFNGIDLFISYAGGNGNDIMLFSAIPEPGLSCLLAFAVIGWACYRPNWRTRSA